MQSTPLPFDAVIFDLDGTLVATERFWVAAARAGARRAFEELGVERPMPSAEQWLSMVGLSLEVGFRLVFPDLDERQRAHVMQRCVEEEEAALRAGGAALMPGALETLTTLRNAGAHIGLASNCGRGYLEHMLNELPLRELVHESRCLDSPGVHSKADMLADLLATFGTRSAVMVGDRSTDSDAARANALPHVHLAQGLAPDGEVVECDAEIPDLAALLPCLARRTEWIESALETTGVLRGGKAVQGGVRTLGVTGHSAAGKSLFARDLARLVETRGRPATLISLDEYLRADAPLAPGVGPGSAADAAAHADPLALAFDVDRLIAGVLEPHRAGQVAATASGVPIPADALVVIDGLFLLHPRARLFLDRVIFLEVTEAASLRRIAARDVPRSGPEALMAARRTLLPVQRAFDAVFEPRARADLVLDAESPLGPVSETV